MAKEYAVLRITQMVRRGDTEMLVNFYRHHIKTAGGVILDVDIDEADFTPEKVKAILTQQALNADKILNL